jgi:DNA-binding MarR family transcriptional regulator
VSLRGEELRIFREQTLYRLLLRARRAENVEMVKQIRARGYEDLLPSYPTLLANLDEEGTSITRLAQRAGITRQAASQRIKEIESRGYVEAVPDPDDGRAVLVLRTRRGKALLRAALEVVSDLEAGYAHHMGEKRFDQLRTLLAELLEHIDSVGKLDEE